MQALAHATHHRMRRAALMGARRPPPPNQVYKGFLVRDGKFVALKKINILQKVGGAARGPASTPARCADARGSV